MPKISRQTRMMVEKAPVKRRFFAYAAGIKPGKQIGEILNTLLALVLEDPQKNTKEYLMSYTLKNLFI